MEQNLCVVTEGIEAKVKQCCEIITVSVSSVVNLQNRVLDGREHCVVNDHSSVLLRSQRIFQDQSR